MGASMIPTQSSKSSQCAVAVSFIRVSASVPRNALSPVCPFILPSRRGSVYIEASTSFAFLSLILCFTFFSITVSYSSWGNQFSLYERNGTAGQIGERAFLWTVVRKQFTKYYSSTQWEGPLLNGLQPLFKNFCAAARLPGPGKPGKGGALPSRASTADCMQPLQGMKCY